MFEDFSNQLRDTPRLRWGLALIIGILWLYGVLILRDNLQEKEQQYTAAARSLQRLRTELTQPEWLGRAAPAKAMAVQLESRLWQAPTSGLAQAAFQEWLSSVIAQSGLKGAQITGAAVDEGTSAAEPNANSSPIPKGLRKVSAKLRFEFVAASLLNLLKLIETSDKLAVVTSLSVRKDPPPSVEMEIVAYFQKQDANDKERSLEKIK